MTDQKGNETTQLYERPDTQRNKDASGAAGAEEWAQMSRETKDSLAAFEHLQRATSEQPDDPRIQASLQQSIFERLKDDPSIAFLGETDSHYIVKFDDARPVLVPKARAQAHVSTPHQRTEGERVLGMVWWIALGFTLGGAGAFIASLFVLRRAVQLLRRRGVAADERRMAWVAIGLASVLGVIGEFFMVLLVLHFLD